MHLTRRHVLLTAFSAAAATALSLSGAGSAAAAAATPAGLGTRDMLRPTDPDAIIPVVSDHWYAEGVSREPLNGWVQCTSGGEL
ncbi:hypothetical protein QR97_34080 [Streptomyces sp. PBH53]|uniref:hypothetical protein n=1 Tax=Streptomyces TaxID=1883 RepID=UPI000654BE69|nr:hypothetical protein [Streptomyces sp. PBH53]AKN74082.1 hypothetical protein QR97_34080 [Streptomyces sp. PBH53]